MHVETSRSHQVLRDGTERTYERHLLRRSFRDGGKVRKETLANLSILPPEAIAAVRAVLAGKTLIDADAAFEVTRSLPHGHAAAVAAMARKLGFPALLGPPGPDRDLALALGRQMTPQSSPSPQPPVWADGQAQAGGVGQFLLLKGERDLGQGLLEAGNPAVLDRAQPVPGRQYFGLDDAQRLGGGGVPHRRFEGGGMGLPRPGHGRTIPGNGDRDDAGWAGRVPDSHGDGIGDRHRRGPAIGGQPDRPLTAQHRCPQQPPLGVGAAAVPLRGGPRLGLAEPAEFSLEDPELPVEQVGAAPRDLQAPGQPEPSRSAWRHGEPRPAHGWPPPG